MYFEAITEYCLLVKQPIIHFRITFIFPNLPGLKKIDIEFKVEKIFFAVI